MTTIRTALSARGFEIVRRHVDEGGQLGVRVSAEICDQIRRELGVA